MASPDSEDSDSFDETNSDTSDSASVTQVDRSHTEWPLPETLNALAKSMASLCDALVDMEATSFSSGRYKSLLVFHDELWVRGLSSSFNV